MDSQDEASPSKQPSLQDRSRSSKQSRGLSLKQPRDGLPKQPRGDLSKQPSGRPRKRPLSPDSTETMTKTPRTSPYNRNFEQHLIDHEMYTAEDEYPDDRSVPKLDNFKEIQERLLQRRLSLSPSRFADQVFKKFPTAMTSETGRLAIIVARRAKMSGEGRRNVRGTPTM